MSNIALASTTMLCRDNQDNLEVLLLKRNKSLAFAGGVWVFPGGKVDNHELVNGTNEMEAAKLATVREVKEESNIDIDIDRLVFFRHWTTPAVEPRRYATYFFFGDTNYSNSAVVIDDSEIKDHIWLTPQDALDRMYSRELALMPPTFMSLQLISKCKNVHEARRFLASQQPVFVLPELKMQKHKVICIYEGDADYKGLGDNPVNARHRLTMNFQAGTYDFQFDNCAPHILPVNGGMHLSMD